MSTSYQTPPASARRLHRNIIKKGSLSELEKLVDTGGLKLNEYVDDELSMTPIHYAAYIGNYLAVELLLKKNDNKLYIDKNNSSVTENAIDGAFEIISFTLERLEYKDVITKEELLETLTYNYKKLVQDIEENFTKL